MVERGIGADLRRAELGRSGPLHGVVGYLFAGTASG